jgi:hypothetical protein
MMHLRSCDVADVGRHAYPGLKSPGLQSLKQRMGHVQPLVAPGLSQAREQPRVGVAASVDASATAALPRIGARMPTPQRRQSDAARDAGGRQSDAAGGDALRQDPVPSAQRAAAHGPLLRHRALEDSVHVGMPQMLSAVLSAVDGTAVHRTEHAPGPSFLNTGGNSVQSLMQSWSGRRWEAERR